MPRQFVPYTCGDRGQTYFLREKIRPDSSKQSKVVVQLRLDVSRDGEVFAEVFGKVVGILEQGTRSSRASCEVLEVFELNVDGRKRHEITVQISSGPTFHMIMRHESQLRNRRLSSRLQNTGERCFEHANMSGTSAIRIEVRIVGILFGKRGATVIIYEARSTCVRATNPPTSVSGSVPRGCRCRSSLARRRPTRINAP